MRIYRCVCLLCLFVAHPLWAADRVSAGMGYLDGAPASYVVPPAPSPQSKAGAADLFAVKAAQSAQESRRGEAFDDALAYNYDELLPVFSVAAGTRLNLQTRPILAHMLRLALEDIRGYVKQAKTDNPRARPYVEDARILPCETDYLRLTDMQSYPSGHAASGYGAALLLSKVMPERQSLLLARGVRYGDNRVVCGVHHPIDVQQGRKIASAYMEKLVANAQFQADLKCAFEEHQHSIAVRTSAARPAYSADCASLAQRYADEARERIAKTEKARDAFEQK